MLLPLKQQLVWLKLSYAQITDSALSSIGQCTNLIRLQLDHTLVSDHGISYLRSLSRLRVLNLVGTSVEPGEAYVQFYSTIHHLLPVELGAQGAPVQQYELYNGGTVPVHFQVRTITIRHVERA